MPARPPIVTILGHVDHGKTTLLDFIRKSRLAEKEFGGITQKIGAYEIDTAIKGYKTSRITFIDTPGHEAFSFLRARGANVADIALLIIDAKDSVMPQTIESISHIKSAKIPFIVVINKVDLPDANPDKVKNDLLKHEVVVEEKGGEVPSIHISAKTGFGIHELLETILLISADLRLTFDPNAPPKAYIIETKKDKRGIVVSAIIKDGQIKVGDILYADEQKAKVKQLINDLGRPMNFAQPSTPFELLGFTEMPAVGSLITDKPAASQAKVKATPEKMDIMALLRQPEQKKLSLIIKADSQGSLEAISNALVKRENINVVLKGIGNINKSDVFLAKTTQAIIVGFAVAVQPEIKDLAKQEKVIIKTYNIIYEMLEELEEVSELMKEKEAKEKSYKGEAKVLATFIIEREKVYGVKITKGKIGLADEVEIYRQNNLIGKTKLVSLKIRAKTVPEVKKSQEAGMIFSPPLDIGIGDVIKSIS